MNVLSLFDGMSCARIALDRAGVTVGKYYSSEVDKYAIKASQKNYSDIIQLGDINNWRDWDIDWSSIDLVCAGSPCQGFSFAGKQLAFDDPRSKLFFVFVDICQHIADHNPKMKFLLENVRMKKEFQDIISKYMGIEPVMINSALVSAQNRKRFYWTNICDIVQPEDKGVLLMDVLESNDLINDASIKGRYLNKATIIGRRLNDSGHREDYNKDIRITQCLEVRKDNSKSNCLTTVEKDNVITNVEIGRHPDIYNKSKKLFNVNPSGNGMNGWVYDPEYKSPTLTTNKGEGTKIFNENSDKRFRTLTPIECERLQTVPDNYTGCVSNSQRYKMLGNGWTVDVIAHIFKGLI